ncbi:TRAP transporter small permease subunit [Desulfonatronum thioautotrophicum]|uniref:TRAP transporter small permease subunit n=1 Tax=Desulfonatronum thioautotrophicum TaxID=617001 RepID=UPI0005EB5779|nr:TRAP transporter small permease [Desulfonatronum thioautotrophicum]
MIDRLLRFLDFLSRVAGWVAAGFVLLIVLLMSGEILSRSLLGKSTMVVSDFSGYFLVAIVLFGLGFTLREDGHIRIKLVRMRLSEPAGRILDVLIALGCAAMTIFALRASLRMVMGSHRLDMRADTVAQTPFWIPQLVIPIGLALLLIQLLAFIIRRVRS